MGNYCNLNLWVLILICIVIMNDIPITYTQGSGTSNSNMLSSTTSSASKSLARKTTNILTTALASVSAPNSMMSGIQNSSYCNNTLIQMQSSCLTTSTQPMGANLGASTFLNNAVSSRTSKIGANVQIHSTTSTAGAKNSSSLVNPVSKLHINISKRFINTMPVSNVTSNINGRLTTSPRISSPRWRISSPSSSKATVSLVTYVTGVDSSTAYYSPRASPNPQQPSLKSPKRPGMTPNGNDSQPTTQPILMVRFDETKFLSQSLSPDLVATFMVLYIFIIFLAFFGNLLVIFVIAWARMVRSFTDLFILSLAVSDILISTVNMPLQLNLIVTNEWKMGSFLCKFTNYLQAVTIVANILTLTAIAVDRYLVICHSQVSRKIHTKRFAVLGLIVVWSVSLCVVCPQLIVQRIEPRIKIDFKTRYILGIGHLCVESFPKLGPHGLKIYSLTIFLGAYLGPVCIMVFTYGAIAHRLWVQQPIGDILSNPRNHARSIKQKRKVIKMLMLLVVAFTILWFPFFTASLYREFVKTDSTFRITMDFLQLIGYSNCCFNPIIYTFLNKKFQVEFKKIFCRRRRTVITSIEILRSKSNPHSTTHSSSHNDVIVQGLGQPVACLHV